MDIVMLILAAAAAVASIIAAVIAIKAKNKAIKTVNKRIGNDRIENSGTISGIAVNKNTEGIKQNSKQ